MWRQISISEAAAILIAGGKVDNGFYQWAGTIKLRHPEHWRKARKRKELIRTMTNKWVHGDGWWIYDKG